MTDVGIPTAKIPPVPIQRRPLRVIALHVFRLALFVSIVGLIHLRHREFEARRSASGAQPIPIESVRALFPQAERLAIGMNERAATVVLDRDGKTLGHVVQTSPQSDRVVGFSGATNVLIGFDEHEQIVGVRILESRDTREHIAHVERDQRFLSQWNGKQWNEAAYLPRVDTVSGATLTSLAIVEGVRLRLGGQRPALKFPDELRVAEVIPFLPPASSLRARAEQPALTDVLDANGASIGIAVRTTPAADAVIGYQGPTDTLLVFDTASKLVGMALRKSYDNEPYVGYVRDEASFGAHFIDRGYAELSKLDPKAEGIEGVSGATMTSIAVANGIAPALRAAEVRIAAKKPEWNWTARETGTAIVLLLAGVMSVTRLRGNRLLRLTFQVVLVGYLGFVNGDLLSQASLVGWAQAGVPLRSAPGLVLLTAAALLVPAVSRTQLYCHQLCPFGAAQQLLVRKAAPIRNVRLSRTVTTVLRVVPPLLLAVVIATAVRHWPLSLVSLEPFDAFHLRIAGVATLSIAIVGLAISAFIPMAYCRFGCPTGAMLNFLRFHSRSDCWSGRDSVAIGLLVLAASLC